MANTATSIYIDTSGTGPKQTGHPEFELSEAINYSPFTIELWYKHDNVSEAMGSPADWTALMSITNTTAGADNTTASTAGSDFYLMGQYGGGQNYYAFNIYNTDGTSGGEINTSNYDNGEIIRNTSWHHVAIVRQYDEYSSIYHDGMLISGTMGPAATKTNPITGKRVELGFNRFDAGDYPFKGVMDEVRITKDVRYGSIKTPTGLLGTSQNAGPGVNPLKPENVVFLLQANNTTTTSDTIYERTGRGTISVNGTLPYSQTQTLPWANTSFGPFSTSNYLLYENFDAEDFNIANKDFSYEGWFYQTAAGDSGKYPMIMLLSDSGSPYYMYWATHNSNNVSNHLYFNDGSNDTSISERTRGTAITLNKWTHIAICRNYDTLSFHINGRLHNARIDSTPVTSIRSGMTHLRIGAGYNTSDWSHFPGYMDGLRI